MEKALPLLAMQRGSFRKTLPVIGLLNADAGPVTVNMAKACKPMNATPGFSWNANLEYGRRYCVMLSH